MNRKKSNHSPRTRFLQDNPAYQLKHRLVGAAIIIGLAVLVIPVLLKEPNVSATIKRVTTPLEESTAFKSKIKPVGAETGADAVQATKQSDAAENLPAAAEKITTEIDLNKQQPEADSPSETASVAPENSAAEVVAPENSADEVVESDEAIESDPAVESDWTVRVGTFFDRKNIDSISILLKNSGFDAHLTPVQTESGKATRVWLGPYQDKDAAEKVSVRLKTLTGEKGYVTKNAS